MTAMIDWNHSRMFYSPPNITIGEMKGSLPCHRELWDASNATAYIVAKETLDAASLATISRLNTSIAEFISTLMAENWTIDAEICHLNVTLESFSVTSLGTAAKRFDLHCLPNILTEASLAITALAIAACQMNLLQGAYPSIILAITRWRELWDYVRHGMDHQTLLKAGLTRHCHENCILAQHIAQLCRTNPQHAYFQTIGHKSLIPIFRLLAACDSVSTGQEGER